MATVRDLGLALRQKAGFELVAHEEAPNRLRLAGRIREGQTNLNTKNWLLVMDRLLRVSKKSNWSVDLSKHYILPAEKMLYEWRIIFQGEKLVDQYPQILQAIKSAAVAARGEVQEIALTGASSDRNALGGGRRGAGLTDRTAVGPLALNSRQMGG